MLLDTQEPKVFYKSIFFLNWLLYCGIILLKKWLYLALDYFEKNIAKKYQKLKFVSILCPNQLSYLISETMFR